MKEMKTILTGAGITMGTMLLFAPVINALKLESYLAITGFIIFSMFIGFLLGTIYITTHIED